MLRSKGGLGVQDFHKTPEIPFEGGYLEFNFKSRLMEGQTITEHSKCIPRASFSLSLLSTFLAGGNLWINTPTQRHTVTYRWVKLGRKKYLII